MATLKRGGKGVRRVAKANSRASTARKAKARTSGFVDGAMALLPFTEEQLHRIFLAVILGGGVALAWFVASIAGVPAMAQAQVSSLASDAGFEVRHLRVSGNQRMGEQIIFDRVFSRYRDTPMPQVDLAGLREELLELPWVEDARVSRQLPQTLAVDIVERKPHAVLEKPDRLMLIDVNGVELEPVSKDAAKKMLVISGPGASRQVPALERLLEAAPALRPQVIEAEWVGNRRWNLTFKTRQILALPQGDDEAAAALINFARLDGQNRLLGGKVSTFDMRAPPRIYMRIPGRADQVLDGGKSD
ncbi:FtsQ-type POTRA domain-containing protein [Altererythrobacter arenosus]|uniref:Cell division protein FtsQ n=1 Tax=Altererythrobacter arenosus TaxID=3032592 RepID=A0ABY8FX56_9SPHN|nr:cell division protein FtsQ/DivIB [Altererythrobacter sp. CAU 1644]WFL77986.1 FtsQ-type POTRA domain-containing protein [Altererythrobacter sp. CAU 1644]